MGTTLAVTVLVGFCLYFLFKSPKVKGVKDDRWIEDINKGRNYDRDYYDEMNN